MSNKEINPLLAIKMVDKAEVLFTVKDDGLYRVTRAEVDEVIRSMYESKSTGKIIFHFTGTGIVPELQIKGEAVIKLLTEKKL